MAKFIQAYAIVNVHEGSYVDDPDDPGGETYAGISRVHWPKWPGWAYIDVIKAEQAPARLILSAEHYDALSEHHKAFFKVEFWDRVRGDELASQLIANEIYEAGVNVGLFPASQWLQVALNAANDRGRLWRDIAVDGRVGPMTLGAVHTAQIKRRTQTVIRMQNTQQGMHYLNIMQANGNQEKFAGGWFERTV